jgi:hypothetical protein
MNGSARLFAGATTSSVPQRHAVHAPAGGQTPLDGDIMLARTKWVNVLVVGPEQAVSNALALIVDDVEHAVVLDRGSDRLRLPVASRRVDTLIIRSVDMLTHDEQQDLGEWMEATHDRTRVVGTTRAPLFSMVEAGAFSDALYYRLNSVYVDLRSRAAGSPADHV